MNSSKSQASILPDTEGREKPDFDRLKKSCNKFLNNNLNIYNIKNKKEYKNDRDYNSNIFNLQ
jgi:hypothetical protein